MRDGFFQCDVCGDYHCGCLAWEDDLHEEDCEFADENKFLMFDEKQNIYVDISSLRPEEDISE